jgi:hypothetical protein
MLGGGIVPAGGAKQEVGKPMRATTRIIFWIGGAMLAGLGIVLWRLH